MPNADEVVQQQPEMQMTPLGDGKYHEESSSLIGIFQTCSGCNTVSAYESINFKQVINMEYDPKDDFDISGIVGGFRNDLFAQSVAPEVGDDQVYDMEVCNGCQVFNAVNMHQTQIINCLH